MLDKRTQTVPESHHRWSTRAAIALPLFILTSCAGDVGLAGSADELATGAAGELAEGGKGQALAGSPLGCDLHPAKTEAAVEKGYRYTTPNGTTIPAPQVSDVCVQILPGIEPFTSELPWSWQFAFWLATAEWNNNTPVNMRLADLNDFTCDQIIYVEYADITNSQGEVLEGFMAEAEKPTSLGFPGSFITVNRGYDGPLCDPWNRARTGSIADLYWDDKIRIAVHELGHTLGFAHPFEGSLGIQGEHIPGTAQQDRTQLQTYPYYSYPSVMHTLHPFDSTSQGACVGDYDGAVVQWLSADDKLSAQRQFQ